MVQADGIVGAGFFCVPTFGYGSLILRATLVVQEFPPLVVLYPLHLVLVMYVPPLEVHQVCSGGIKTGLKTFLGMPTVFPQFVQILPHDWDVLMPPFSL